MYWDVPRGASYGEKVMRKFKYTIKEEQGIHARPASFLIQEARTYESRITLRVKGKEADASNIIAVMALDVMCGQKVEVEICGTDEGVAYRGMKKFFEEFKAFALKGNMMDMAIGVIIGGAFSTLVTSLTDNLISPILGILGKVNFDAMMWDVFGDGKLVFKYGAFITAVINFLIMAFVLFCTTRRGWGWENFLAEADQGEGVKFPRWTRLWLKYGIPALIVVIFVLGYAPKVAIWLGLA